MAIDKKLIDQLLTDYKGPEDIIGENGLLKELTKAILGTSAGSRDERASGLREGGPSPGIGWPALQTEPSFYRFPMWESSRGFGQLWKADWRIRQD